jgi:hypothetical protein
VVVVSVACRDVCVPVRWVELLVLIGVVVSQTGMSDWDVGTHELIDGDGDGDRRPRSSGGWTLDVGRLGGGVSQRVWFDC